MVEKGGCSLSRLGCWYRRHQVRREKQEPGDSVAVVDGFPSTGMDWLTGSLKPIIQKPLT